MNDFKLGQEFVTRVTMEDTDDVSVVGLPSKEALDKLPSHEDWLNIRKEIDLVIFELEYRRAYVARFVERGIPYDVAVESFHAVPFDEISEYPPCEAADNEIECWD